MRILRFPIIRLVLAVFFFITFLGSGVFITSVIRGLILKGGHPITGDFIQMIVLSLMAIVGYWIYCGLVEGRTPTELSRKHLVVQTGA
ncbi:MAG: hypothetical protein PHF53_11135, partial [Bacteroidales bacterium]|nr:hypothetical protein [Bacteroidales bacterium]